MLVDSDSPVYRLVHQALCLPLVAEGGVAADPGCCLLLHHALQPSRHSDPNMNAKKMSQKMLTQNRRKWTTITWVKMSSWMTSIVTWQ